MNGKNREEIKDHITNFTLSALDLVLELELVGLVVEREPDLFLLAEDDRSLNAAEERSLSLKSLPLDFL